MWSQYAIDLKMALEGIRRCKYLLKLSSYRAPTTNERTKTERKSFFARFRSFNVCLRFVLRPDVEMVPMQRRKRPILISFSVDKSIFNVLKIFRYQNTPN